MHHRSQRYWHCFLHRSQLIHDNSSLHTSDLLKPRTSLNSLVESRLNIIGKCFSQTLLNFQTLLQSIDVLGIINSHGTWHSAQYFENLFRGVMLLILQLHNDLACDLVNIFTKLRIRSQKPTIQTYTACSSKILNSFKLFFIILDFSLSFTSLGHILNKI